MQTKFKRPASLVYLIFISCLLWYAATTLQFCSQELGYASHQINKSDFLGDQYCQSCHQEAYNDWYNSHHDLAMQEANEKTVLGNFDDITFEMDDSAFRFFKKEGKYYVHTQGPEGIPQDFEIKYTFGVEPLQQYLIEFPGGRMQCLPATWDTEKQKWYNVQVEKPQDQEDWMHWSKGSMTWNTMCADCHSTYLDKNYDGKADAFQTDWAIIDVSCEACHGPGKQHVAYINSKAYKKGETVDGSYLELTANLQSKEQVEQCARCHSFRTQISDVFDHSGKLMDHYVPNLLHPGSYYGDGQILGEVYVYGSFLQSKMYAHNVKCTNCHNPHSLNLIAIGNDLCAQCHVKETYDVEAHHFHPVGSEGAQCINCHMTGRNYMGDDYRRDHSFRVPRPDLSVRYQTPNACNQCHTDKSSVWAAGAVEEWYGKERAPHYAEALLAANNGEPGAVSGLVHMMEDTMTAEIVRATALWILSQHNDPQGQSAILEALQNENDLIRHTAASNMEAFPAEIKLQYLTPLLQDSVLAIRTQAALSMIDLPQGSLAATYAEHLQSALKEYEIILAQQIDFPSGHMMQGQYYHRQGDLPRAEAAYKEAIRKDPYLSSARMNLGNLYYQQQQLDRAEEQFFKVVDVEPQNGEAHYYLGLLLAEQQKLKAATPHLGKAAKITGNPRYYYNWGLSYQHQQLRKEAEAAFLQGLEIDPNSMENLYALSILHIQQQEGAKARPYLEQLLKMDPQNAQFQQLLQAL